MPKLLVLFLALGLCLSCSSDMVVSEMKTLPGYWDQNQKLEYVIPELDSLKKYHVFFHIRNSNDYPFNNIFLIASMQFPHGKTVTDTLEYRMAAPDGTWLGTGIGEIKESKLWYKESVQFFEKGNYILTLSQAVRNNGEVSGVSQLKGITEVGYSIEEATP